VGKLQKELIEKVDFVLATSRDLWEWAATVRSNNLFYLPNGVDGQFFEQARNKPDDFPETKRPVAVYAGTLDTRFDLETVAGAVEALPGMHFLLIGPVTYRALEAGLESLKRHENFTALGAKPFAALPAYLQRCSAGMIPFHLNELTGAVNPIKYYEYLACGLPVIAPPMREMAETEGPVNIYRNREEFVRMLKKVAAAKDEERQQLKLYAGDNTWLVRFKEIEKIIDRLMK
jgi:glycosyltransferase involved in cell wall biosynthesis